MTGADRTVPAGVILTGGASRRMGRDKAFVEVDGVPMVRRVALALAAAGCDPVRCQGGDRERLRALGLEADPDPQPGGGPVAALAAVVARHPGGVLVAACDLPELDPGRLRELIGNGPAAWVTGGLAHLVAWFPAGTLIPPGVVRYQDLIGKLHARLIEVPGVRNVNTPADL